MSMFTLQMEKPGFRLSPRKATSYKLLASFPYALTPLLSYALVDER
jgi:hypothetical protein